MGLDNAGKTTILYQFLMNEVVHTSPTIGSNVEEVRARITLELGFDSSLQVVWNNIHFVMWDLGGQESLRTAWNTYYSNTQFIILVRGCSQGDCLHRETMDLLFTAARTFYLKSNNRHFSGAMRCC